MKNNKIEEILNEKNLFNKITEVFNYINTNNKILKDIFLDELNRFKIDKIMNIEVSLKQFEKNIIYLYNKQTDIYNESKLNIINKKNKNKIKNEDFKIKIDKLNKEITDKKIIIDQMKSLIYNIELENNNLNIKLNKINDKFDNLKLEIINKKKNFNEKIKEKEDDIMKIKTKLVKENKELTINFNSKEENFNQKIKVLENNNIILNEKILKLTDELNKKKHIFNETKEKIKNEEITKEQLEKYSKLLKKFNENNNNYNISKKLNIDYQIEIESLKNKLENNNKNEQDKDTNNIYQDLKKNSNKITSENEQLKSTIKKLKNHNNKLEKKLNNITEENNHIFEELEYIKINSNLNNNYEEEYNKLKYELNEKNKLLNGILENDKNEKDYKKIINDLNNEYINLRNVNKEQEEDIRNLLYKLDIITMENYSLRKEIDININEILNINIETNNKIFQYKDCFSDLRLIIKDNKLKCYFDKIDLLYVNCNDNEKEEIENYISEEILKYPNINNYNYIKTKCYDFKIKKIFFNEIYFIILNEFNILYIYNHKFELLCFYNNMKQYENIDFIEINYHNLNYLYFSFISNNIFIEVRYDNLKNTFNEEYNKTFHMKISYFCYKKNDKILGFETGEIFLIKNNKQKMNNKLIFCKIIYLYSFSNFLFIIDEKDNNNIIEINNDLLCFQYQEFTEYLIEEVKYYNNLLYIQEKNKLIILKKTMIKFSQVKIIDFKYNIIYFDVFKNDYLMIYFDNDKLKIYDNDNILEEEHEVKLNQMIFGRFEMFLFNQNNKIHYYYKNN